MPRARNLKPDFFKDEQLAECGFAGMVLFAGLWCLADREGRMEDRPLWIAAEVFPYERPDVPKLLAMLAERRFIIRYEVEGKHYIQVRNFKKHQNPHLKEKPSTIPPAPGQHHASTVLVPDFPGQAPDKHSASTGNSGTSPVISRSSPVITGTSPADSGFLIPDSGSLNPSTPGSAPVDSLVSEICQEMRAKHRKTTGLGGMELERTLCTVAADAVDPPAVLRAIRARWRLGVEREWSNSESKFWPNLLEWIGRRRYLDPPPPEREVAGLERPTKSRLEALIDSL